MTEEDEELYSNTNICRFCQKNIEADKIRDHCHLTSKYRGTAHNKCKNNVTKNKVFFLHFVHKFSNYDCHLIMRKLVDK